MRGIASGYRQPHGEAHFIDSLAPLNRQQFFTNNQPTV
jgi:hypothetical protein